jgi:hypothetical protein
MIEGPLFVVEGHDVNAFRDSTALEGIVEAYDIDALRCFRADGTELRLGASGWHAAVKDEVIGRYPDELQAILRHCLTAVPARRRSLTDEEIRNASLEQLVDAMVKLGLR